MIYKEFYAGMDWSVLPIVGLLFFLVAFGLVVLRTYAYKSRADFDSVAALPLADGSSSPASEVKP